MNYYGETAIELGARLDRSLRESVTAEAYGWLQEGVQELAEAFEESEEAWRGAIHMAGILGTLITPDDDDDEPPTSREAMLHAFITVFVNHPCALAVLRKEQ